MQLFRFYNGTLDKAVDARAMDALVIFTFTHIRCAVHAGMAKEWGIVLPENFAFELMPEPGEIEDEDEDEEEEGDEEEDGTSEDETDSDKTDSENSVQWV